MNEKEKIKILNYAYDYLFGSLWWGAEAFILERFDDWQESEDTRKGHPLLSLCKTPAEASYDEVPMLVGTSVKGKPPRDALLIHVSPDHLTDFSVQTESNNIFADDFLYHSSECDIEDDPTMPVWNRRRLWPNWDKTHVSEEELIDIHRYLAERKEAAIQNKGKNK